MKNTISLPVSDMQHAISSWNSVRNTAAGYYYLTSGTRFEFPKQHYTQWLDLKKKGAKIDKIYCHLGVWNNELIFILSPASRPKDLKKESAFAMLFYTDLNEDELQSTTTSQDTTNQGKGSNIITEKEAMTRLMNWMLYSQEWFQEQTDNKKEIMKYIEIDFTDFSDIFDTGVKSLISFFAIRDTKEHGNVVELILASKPTPNAVNAKLDPNGMVYTDATRPCPPFTV